MLLLILVTTISAPDSDVVVVKKAQALYDKARYTAALRVLGPSCAPEAGVFANCERLRAMALIGLGRTDEATVAFQRLVSNDLKASVPKDAPPKAKRLFREAKRMVESLMAARLQPPFWAGAGPVPLELSTTGEVPITSFTAYVAAEGADFVAVPLEKEDRLWSARARLRLAGKSLVRYYLVAGLDGGVEISIGSADEPLELKLAGSASPTTGGKVNLDQEAAAVVKDDGIPTWGIVAIIGGGVVVVGAITAGIIAAAAGGSSPSAGEGTITLGLEFEDG